MVLGLLLLRALHSDWLEVGNGVNQSYNGYVHNKAHVGQPQTGKNRIYSYKVENLRHL